MPKDIVERNGADSYDIEGIHGDIRREAATEIERLRGLLFDVEMISNNPLARRLMMEAAGAPRSIHEPAPVPRPVTAPIEVDSSDWAFR